MKIKSKSTLLALMLVAVTQYAVADPVTVNITGNVVASPCTLDTANSDLAIDLGNIQATDLASVGITSTPKSFNLAVNACPAATTNVVLSFGGTEDSQAPGRYANTGTATNVAVEVLQASNGTLKGPGTTLSLPVQTDRTAIFNLQTRAYAKGQATPGSIVSTMQATFIYQ